MAKGGQTPKDTGSARMKAAWARYDAGDVKTARREARALLATPETPEDAEQARDLLQRTALPRPVLVTAAVALALLIALLVLGIARNG
jgi:hypothetical protein